MVGLMAVNFKERTADLLKTAKFSPETSVKLKTLRPLTELIRQMDSSLLSDLVPLVMELKNDPSSPVRKLLAEVIGEIGLKRSEFVPDMVPVLITFLKDAVPAVVRQAITTGTDIFRHTFAKIAIEGLFSGELEKSVEASWAWMLKFKDAVVPIAFQPGSDGVRLLAIRFVEVVVLLYTPDPNGPSQPPLHLGYDADTGGFDISWLRGGHPLLNVGHLAVEASQSLGLLLDQLRFPSLKSLSNSIIIVLINSLSAIAKRRPSYYGHILPVLLSLDPSNSVVKGVPIAGANHALKNAFTSCLDCSHPGVAPWRDRLLDALDSMNSGQNAEESVCQVDQVCETSAQISCEPQPMKEESPFIQSPEPARSDQVRKRSLTPEAKDLIEMDDPSGSSGKRVKATLTEDSTKELLHPNSGSARDGVPSSGEVISTKDNDSGAVQQLVAMFGALVAQGDRAATSLEILISSISSDLLAEVVLANMRFLPPTCPQSEEEVVAGTDTVSPQPSLLLNILSLLNPQLPASCDTLLDGGNLQQTETVNVATEVPSYSVSLALHGTEQGESDMASETNEVLATASEVPGLDTKTCNFEIQETVEVSHSSTVDTQGTNQDQATSVGDYVSEASSQKLSTESNSVIISCQLFLPKMVAPVIDITDEEKDNLQKLAFVRVVEAYKQIAVSGGSHIRFSLLAYLGAEYPLELDSWGLLQKHILADYLNHEGHELTLRVLYRLYRDIEQDQDFFSSTTATSIYETFLLAVAETLRDSFPASDKSLSRLLGEVPYLTKTAFKLLECLCSPGTDKKSGKEAVSGDRVTQGLSAVWNLILLRPPIRDECLKIALNSAVHLWEEVRMKAIRLVANKLYPMFCISKKIEDFANEMLFSVINNSHVSDSTSAEEASNAVQKEHDVEKHVTGGLSSTSGPTKEHVFDTSSQLAAGQSISSAGAAEAQRCMSLYFALCTKKHSLLRQIFVIYKDLPKAAKQAVHRHIPILVRTIGTSSELLAIISAPPDGSESLLMQVLQTLTEGTVPSPELVLTVRKLYDSKLKDVEILIPILASLSKDEVLPIFPQLVNLPPDKFQTAVSKLLQGSPHASPSLTPAELLIAIHGIDPERDGVPLKKVMDACSACFEQRQVFTQQVFAKALNQLVEQIPLPLLFMRTVIQSIGVFPALVDFIMEILSRLVSKQIWKYPKLWVGFLKCTLQTKPQSFSVLLQLPAAQLENALNRNPALRAPLVAYANQSNIRPSLPKSTLVVLGLAQEPHSQTQSQVQIADAVNSTEAGTETTQESSVVS
ncbi:hypothetical protein H6P81_006298 [Aristolochia fimbriata]|uniref:Symplekin n=1 Tax=Aristolochia fimbriata TaxID=158543 RepID=A0AAV7EY37_ARIFI|nr:hypothetical protein H6P81_006298 [Aristolochia fimbriata]